MWAAFLSSHYSSQFTVCNCQLCENVFFFKISPKSEETDKIKHALETSFLSHYFHILWLFYFKSRFRAKLPCKSVNTFFQNLGESYLCNKTTDRQNTTCLRNANIFSFFHILLFFKFKLRFHDKIAMWLEHSALILELILYGLGRGRWGRTSNRMAKN